MSNTAIIEVLTTGGTWQRVCDCGNRPALITGRLEAALRERYWATKARAIDSETKQLIDMAFK